MRLLALLSCALAIGCADHEPVETRYLAFQIDWRTQPPATSANAIVDVLGGATGDGVTRQVAFFINGLSLDTSDAETRRTIDDAFAVAEQTGVAVGFHVEDSMAWITRTDLNTVIDNIEWVDWNKTPAPERTWGVGGQKLGAPQICYESPAMRAETYRIAKDVIGAEIAKNVARLDSTGKRYLFAGVLMGWETRLDGVGVAGMVTAQTGYCSLTQRGFSAANPPPDLAHELQIAVQRWADNWCQGIVDGGVARDRVFTHMPFMIDPKDAATEYAPPWTAVNDHSSPGYTAYADNLDEELAAVHSARWAVAEGTNVSGPPDNLVVNPIPWSEYLGRLYDGNAVLVNVFGWGAPGYGDSTQSDEAIATYKKFLAGQPLR